MEESIPKTEFKPFKKPTKFEQKSSIQYKKYLDEFYSNEWMQNYFKTDTMANAEKVDKLDKIEKADK